MRKSYIDYKDFKKVDTISHAKGETKISDQREVKKRSYRKAKEEKKHLFQEESPEED